LNGSLIFFVIISIELYKKECNNKIKKTSSP
jgi:hypothetical protein